jgi:type IV pilus assembly protein PilY1
VFTDQDIGSLGGTSYNAGDEIFAFVPADLLSKLKEFANVDTHIFMVDGSPQLHRAQTYDDDNVNDQRDTGEYYHKTLVFGERRGGRSYWALDVTSPDPSDWKVKWHIQGGTGGVTTPKTVRIEELGYTWSKPWFAKVRTASDTVKNVVIFAGGYDSMEDGFPEAFDDANENGRWDSGESHAVTVRGTEGYDTHNPGKSTMGRGIYVLDIDDGSLLFSATYGTTDDTTDDTIPVEFTFADMWYCFPADISVIPLSENKLIMYAADIYGQIWKLTFDYFASPKWKGTRVFQANPGSDLATGDTDIAGASFNTADTGRKTFYSPDISFFGNCWTSKPVLYFGTGDRAHPRYTMISNRFYAVADFNGQPDVTNETHLLNLTCNELEDENPVDADHDGTIDGDDTLRQADLKAILNDPSQSRGFFKVLDKQGDCVSGMHDHSGEQVLSQPTLFFKNVYFTSYQPDFADPCNPMGNAFIYALDYCWGTSVFDFSDDNSTDRDIRDTYQMLEGASIPSGVRVITRGGHAAGLISAGGAVAGVGKDLTTNIPGPPGGVSQMLWETE